ncbi:hypothetical protein AX16_005715 [Volvariella volvacea WC 439]|nr:hypothetical protein AX16_005715 [Volvariella volvacea WC 439]
MPLHHLAVGVKIARERTVLSWRFLKWTIVTALSLTLIGAQTTAWSTLLTPAKIHLPVDLSGYELDISNPEVYEMAANRTREGSLYPDGQTVVGQTVQASGAAAVNAKFGFPGDIVNFNQISFVNSTGGIMPVFLRDVQSVLNTQSHYASTINLEYGVESPRGFDTTFEMIQQGMTVQTTCTAKDPQSVDVRNQTLNLRGFGLMAVLLDVTCTDGATMKADDNTAVITRIPQGETTDASAVLVSPCPMSNHPGAYEFIIHAFGGTYDMIGTLSCEMIPKLTSVRVQYEESQAGTEESAYSFVATILEVVKEREVEDADFAVAPFSVLYRNFQSGQGWWGSTFGNTVSEVYASKKPDQKVVEKTVEAYLTGVFEFGATLMQAVMTRSNNSFIPDQIPTTLRHNTTGTLYIETLGWDFRSDARDREGGSLTAPGLLAATLLIPTLVAISAITFTVIAVIANLRDKMLQYQAHVDMGDFMQLMALTHSDQYRFPTLDSNEGDFMNYSKVSKLRVRLQKDARGQIELIMEEGGY